MSMVEAHRKQRDDNVRSSLEIAGIGRRYHGMRFVNLPAAAPVQAWFDNPDMGDRHKDGEGVTIHGGGTDSYDAMILLARALHLSGRRAKVMTLPRLVHEMQNGSDDGFDPLSVNSLFLTDFSEIYGAPGCPLTPWQIASIETLLTTRVDGGRPNFLLVARWGGPTWWSERFVQRVAKSNTLIEIKS